MYSYIYLSFSSVHASRRLTFALRCVALRNMHDPVNRVCGEATYKIGIRIFTLHACKSYIQQDSLNSTTVLWRVHTSIYIYIYRETEREQKERERERERAREIHLCIYLYIYICLCLYKWNVLLGLVVARYQAKTCSTFSILGHALFPNLWLGF